MNKEIKIVNIDGAEVPLQLMADDIERIARAGDAILKCRLTERALVILLQDAISGPKVPQNTIQQVLKAIPALRSALKQRKNKP